MRRMRSSVGRLRWSLPIRWRRYRDRRWRRHLQRTGVDVDVDAFVARGVLVPAGCSIGRGSALHRGVVLRGTAPISVGNFCALAEGTQVISSNHEINRPNLNVKWQRKLAGGRNLRQDKGPMRIGHAVWIGANALVLPGVDVGNGAVVAAGAVVTKDVAPFAVVAGNPARELRKRFSEPVIAELEEVAWWSWSDEKLGSNERFFVADLTQEGVRVADLVS